MIAGRGSQVPPPQCMVWCCILAAPLRETWACQCVPTHRESATRRATHAPVLPIPAALELAHFLEMHELNVTGLGSFALLCKGAHLKFRWAPGIYLTI